LKTLKPSLKHLPLNGIVLAVSAALCLWCGQAKADPPAPGGALSGTVAANSDAVRLTLDGPLDWAHWYGYDHKATAGSRISDVTVIGGASQTYDDDPRAMSWTDGTPTVSSSDNHGGSFIAGIGNGFSFTVPADTSLKTLKIYIGGWQAGGTLTAQLSDASAPDYGDTSLSTEPGSDEAFNGVYSLTYRAASAGQSLTVTWTMASGDGNVMLQAATLGATATTLPEAPSDLIATVVSQRKIALIWTDHADNENWFSIERSLTGLEGDWVEIAGLGANVTAYNDHGLVPGAQYFYRVRAVNSLGGSDYSNVADATTWTPPPGGALLGTAAANSDAVDLTSDGPLDWVHWYGYDHKATGGGMISDVTVIGGTSQIYDDDPRAMSWADGTPTAASSDNHGGRYIAGMGNGFSFTAPADTS
jgi:hypothetical protein